MTTRSVENHVNLKVPKFTVAGLAPRPKRPRPASPTQHPAAEFGPLHIMRGVARESYRHGVRVISTSKVDMGSSDCS